MSGPWIKANWKWSKGMTKDEMAGWHHGLDGRESEWTPGYGDGQGGLACCDSWGRKQSDTIEQLNWTELNLPWFMDLTFQVPMQYCSLQHRTLLLSSVTSNNWMLFLLWLHLFILSGVISPLISSSIGHLLTWGVPLSVFCLFAFSYCSWGSQGTNPEVVCRSLLQWTTFCLHLTCRTCF